MKKNIPYLKLVREIMNLRGTEKLSSVINKQKKIPLPYFPSLYCCPFFRVFNVSQLKFNKTSTLLSVKTETCVNYGPR